MNNHWARSRLDIGGDKPRAVGTKLHELVYQQVQMLLGQQRTYLFVNQRPTGHNMSLFDILCQALNIKKPPCIKVAL